MEARMILLKKPIFAVGSFSKVVKRIVVIDSWSGLKRIDILSQTDEGSTMISDQRENVGLVSLERTTWLRKMEGRSRTDLDRAYIDLTQQSGPERERPSICCRHGPSPWMDRCQGGQTHGDGPPGRKGSASASWPARLSLKSRYMGMLHLLGRIRKN